MALTNIHEFVDDEIITHDDLNSIGEAVSSELTGGGSGRVASCGPWYARATST